MVSDERFARITFPPQPDRKGGRSRTPDPKRRSGRRSEPEIPSGYGDVYAYFRAGVSSVFQEKTSHVTPSGDGDVVGTAINSLSQIANPIDKWVAPSNLARPIYRADAYSSGYPALEFDGIDDRLQFYNSTLSFAGLGTLGATMVTVFNSVTKGDTYGVVGLSGVPNDPQYQSVYHVASTGVLGHYNRDESEGESGKGGGAGWNVGAYDYLTNDGPHIEGSVWDTTANIMECTYATTDKSLEADTYPQNIADLEDHSTMYIGGASAAIVHHYGQGYVHAIILFAGQMAENRLNRLLRQIKLNWYP